MKIFRIHKYLFIACIYFFINCPVFFPQGLLITSILAPWFYFRLLQKKKRFVLELYLVVTFPFILANMMTGFNLTIFLPSYLLLLTCYATTYEFADAISETYSLDEVIRPIIWMNLGLAFVGLVVRFTSAYPLMWQSLDEVNEGLRLIRFRGFTYEPSYYSTLMVPLVLYAYWLFVKTKKRRALYLLIATLIPLGMSLSFGIIAIMAFTLTCVHLFYGKGFARLKWVFGVVIVLVVGYLVLPADNMIKVRVDHLVTGHDSSASIRTVGAFTAAYSMATARDIWFGVGFGEVKEYGNEFIDWKNGRLPSALADTLGEFGLAGIVLRFGLEIYFFFKTRPDQDPYRLCLFMCMFLFQFAGSYNGNLAEYVIWIMAFCPSVGFFSVREPKPVRQIPFQAVPQFT